MSRDYPDTYAGKHWRGVRSTWTHPDGQQRSLGAGIELTAEGFHRRSSSSPSFPANLDQHHSKMPGSGAQERGRTSSHTPDNRQQRCQSESRELLEHRRPPCGVAGGVPGAERSIDTPLHGRQLARGQQRERQMLPPHQTRSGESRPPVDRVRDDRSTSRSRCHRRAIILCAASTTVTCVPSGSFCSSPGGMLRAGPAAGFWVGVDAVHGEVPD